MIYTIPVVLLVFVLGRNLTLDDNTLLESQTQTKTGGWELQNTKISNRQKAF